MRPEPWAWPALSSLALVPQSCNSWLSMLVAGGGGQKPLGIHSTQVCFQLEILMFEILEKDRVRPFYLWEYVVMFSMFVG